MGWVATWVAAHGYFAVAVVLFTSALGLPMPVAVTLLLAGTAVHTAQLSLGLLLLIAIFAENFGATLMFFAGRATGWWLLNRLCSLSFNPEVCIFRSADFFYERGSLTLLFARFIPGLNTMAPPLAGSLNMRPLRFWRLDVTGAILHVCAWVAAGYFLAPIIRRVLAGLQIFGHWIFSVFVVAVLAYALTRLAMAIHGRKYSRVARVKAEELRERLEHPDPAHPIVIADVRSHGYYDPGMQRIKNSIRIEPSRLLPELEALRETIAPICDIYVYCSCRGDATSARVAHMLEQRGNRVFVIEGGLTAWMKAGCPTEPVPEDDIRHLPRFE
ncbi:MAG: VTT domain-containing protein [Acidobacteria bacterium]|nr:VTT domain-containing protein [Acidobacteriota bacterium]